MRLVLLGPPGAGKGTQAAAIKGRFGIPHISTGEMLRGAISAGTPVGRRARGIVEGGQLVPDDLMKEMVRDRLAAPDAARGFLLDGYPRNLAQAAALDSILTELHLSLDCVVFLALDDAAVVRRLSGRRTCGSCGAPYHVRGAPPRKEGICDACGGALKQRADDDEKTVAERLRVFREQTEPLVRHYEGRGLLVEVDAGVEIATVTERVAGMLEARTAGSEREDQGGRS